MSSHKTLDTLAREVVCQHSRLALQADPLDRLPMHLAPQPTTIIDPAGQAVYAACHALDFIDIDAQCVASAWQRQSARTGQFDASAWPTDPQDFDLPRFDFHEPPPLGSGALWERRPVGAAPSPRIPPNSLRPEGGPPTKAGAVSCDSSDLWERRPRREYPESGSALADGFASCPHRLGLYAVLPDAAWVGRMARAGVPTVQLRFKSADPAAITREVEAAVQAVQGTGALLFINDHWQAAIAAGAYGVHLGQEDLEALGGADLNAIRAAGLRLGLSSHGYAEMLRAASVRPSYIAMGAVYATTLKRMATPPQGLARLTMYAALLRDTPTVAIGGIDAARLPEVLSSGVGSVAVVRALVAADQPEAQVAALQAMF
ncbi:thiamine phosphate synthase [Rhodoferax sp.]|uniref:thiamine phosphate synthase n=1 Tax=Rhodoferax sp. TaxID=50421 RepID=UPI0026191730|nr:thiamine phosphate synthase [Rhodoferax sp.]MDD3934926.1 thiamine phosphate synthase [Rhodoferax sp.]